MTAFDTLKFANTLKAAGVPEKQAEAEASIFAEMLQINLKELTTKTDLEIFGKDLRHEMQELAKESRREIADLRVEFQREFVSMRREIADLRVEFQREFVSVRREMQEQRSELIRAIESSKTECLQATNELRKEFEINRAKVSGEFLLLRWMLGAILAGVGGLLYRLFVMRSPV